MSFAPVLPLGGIAGWALLQRVESDQRAAFARRPDMTRDAERFAAEIGRADTAAKLVSDRRLLSVALAAFGLESEIDKGALIRKALESDPNDRTSFAARMVDPRYRQLAAAFGYGDPLRGPQVAREGFADAILARFRDRRYEAAVGEADPSMRLALNARRELAAYARSADPDRAAWFALMGDRPVRQVVEKAFGLPSDFGKLDVDRQRDVLRARTRDLFGDGSLAVFADPARIETLIRRFLAREAALSGPTAATPGAAAVALLGGGGLGAAGTRNLVLSLLS